MAVAPLALYQATVSEVFNWYNTQTANLLSLVGAMANRAPIPCTPPAPPFPAKDSELFVGKSLSLSKTVIDDDTVAFGRLSLDYNPLHFDEALARQTRFGGRIAHGMHTAALFSGVLAQLTPWCAYLHQDLEFTAPVRSGDVVTATGTIAEITAKGVVEVELICRNQNEEVVVRGKAHVKKLKEAYQAA
jgi:3-hydroxybutyryl-CoA dehydratase